MNSFSFKGQWLFLPTPKDIATYFFSVINALLNFIYLFSLNWFYQID